MKWLCLLLVLGTLVRAEENPSPASRTQAVVKICQKLVDDMKLHVKEGDAGIRDVLASSKWNGEVDWDVAAKDPKALEATLQTVCLELLKLQNIDDNAKALVKKYDIKQSGS